MGGQQHVEMALGQHEDLVRVSARVRVRVRARAPVNEDKMCREATLPYLPQPR